MLRQTKVCRQLKPNDLLALLPNVRTRRKLHPPGSAKAFSCSGDSGLDHHRCGRTRMDGADRSGADFGFIKPDERLLADLHILQLHLSSDLRALAPSRGTPNGSMLALFRSLLRIDGGRTCLPTLAFDRRDRADPAILAVPFADSDIGRLVADDLRNLGKHTCFTLPHRHDPGRSLCNVYRSGAR